METVSKLVDAGYKAIWGDVDTRTEVQHDERRQSEDQSKKTSGVASTPSIKVIDAGEQSLWPGTSNMNIPHAEGEEPVSGVTGKGTSTDPYDAGNRDEQPEAPPIDIGDARTQVVEGNSVASNSSPRLDLTMDPDFPIARDTGDTSSKFLGVPGHDQALGGTTGCEPKSESGVGKDQSESEKLARGLREIQLSKDHDTTISFETSSTEAICDSSGVESDVKTASASEEHTTFPRPRDETAAVATSSFTNPVNSVSDPGRSDSSSSSTSPSSSSSSSSSSSAGEDGVGSNVDGTGHKRVKSKILAKVKEKLDIGKHRHSKHSRSAKASLGK
ncbi:hypothetical protein Egran_03646 [Elaphomyces granulatus]|uniref:Uncharacterized protein n=1 Tax=Elaphomyces granulatus TaxID=519963 RepID=A0A232LWP3_9EURO|nr:hypothetical protein Egran_03646 [Elaphomyces granulatus]